MNQLQKIEFDIFYVFSEVCKKLGLTYYLVCGSALGAAKYQGFIPWDDDLDVGMPRTDYEVFQTEAGKLLPPHLFLQNYKTDIKYPMLFSKLRDDRTTFIEKGLSKLDINHGIYIDIFPLDGYPYNVNEQQILEKRKRIYKLQTLSAIKPNFDMKLITRAFLKTERFFGYHKRTEQILDKLTSLLSANRPEESSVWCNHGNWQGRLEYAPREQYGEGKWATFEGLKVRIPERYDEYLTQKYGNWREDLPEDQKVGHHYAEVIDLERPYTDYIVKLKNGKMRLKTSAELLNYGIIPPEGYKY